MKIVGDLAKRTHQRPVLPDPIILNVSLTDLIFHFKLLNIVFNVYSAHIIDLIQNSGDFA